MLEPDQPLFLVSQSNLFQVLDLAKVAARVILEMLHIKQSCDLKKNHLYLCFQMAIYRNNPDGATKYELYNHVLLPNLKWQVVDSR